MIIKHFDTLDGRHGMKLAWKMPFNAFTLCKIEDVVECKIKETQFLKFLEFQVQLSEISQEPWSCLLHKANADPRKGQYWLVVVNSTKNGQKQFQWILPQHRKLLSITNGLPKKWNQLYTPTHFMRIQTFS